jgi:hypothetical protein
LLILLFSGTIWPIRFSISLYEEASIMFKRTTLLVVLLLAVSILSASAEMSIESWVDQVGDYSAYWWLVHNPPSNMSVFAVEAPDTAHFCQIVTDCGWKFELSRYDPNRVPLLRSHGNTMWTFAYRDESSRDTPSSFLLSYWTSNTFASGTTQYAIVAGSQTFCGTTLGPTTTAVTVPEPGPIAALFAGLITCVVILLRK